MGRQIRFELLIVLFALCSIAVFAVDFEWAIYAEPDDVTWTEEFTLAHNLPKQEFFNGFVFP